MFTDKQDRVDRGVFYTPDIYAKITAGYIIDYVSQLPQDKDFVVIDRACGQGALIKFLPDYILSKTIINTIDSREYQYLVDNYGNKVDRVYNRDALEKPYFDSYVEEKVKNPNTVVIMIENPPYSEAGSKSLRKLEDNTANSFKKSYLCSQFKNDIKNMTISTVDINNNPKKISHVASNDICNIFIWSAFKYYLSKQNDIYIVYAPVKYWKNHHIVNKKPLKSFLCNRKHFGATNGGISCIMWQNVDSNINDLVFPIYEIDTQGNIVEKGTKVCKKVFTMINQCIEKKGYDELIADGIVCDYDGTEYDISSGKYQLRSKPYHNPYSIAVLLSWGQLIDRFNTYLIRVILYNQKGFFLYKDNYLEFLPFFATLSMLDFIDYYDLSILSKTFDKGYMYKNDTDFIKSCFIYTNLTRYNKCLSFYGSDNRFYRNELCFDRDTVAYQDLSKFTLTEEEKELLEINDRLLSIIKTKPNYNPDYRYGPYQIEKDFNTFTKEKNKKRVYDDLVLNDTLLLLKSKLKDYYKNNIYQKMFDYELIK